MDKVARSDGLCHGDCLLSSERQPIEKTITENFRISKAFRSNAI